jgi:ATP adenylyltransferase
MKPMDNLWAPWRLPYVVAAAKPPSGESPCFLCQGLAQNSDRDNLIVERTKWSAVVLNRFPYNNGHLLVAPRAHKANLQELSSDEHLDLMQTVTQMVERLAGILRPEGFNVGLNLGRVAGAGLPGHLHWHIVPRWDGDTNFMPILAGTKVIVQSLESLYDLLKPATT